MERLNIPENIKQFGLGIIIAWLIIPPFFSAWLHFDLDALSKAGDAFNTVGTLFSALTLLAAGCAVYLQAQQLEEAKEGQTQQERLSRLTARLTAIPILIDHCNRRLANFPHQIPITVFAATTEKIISILETDIGHFNAISIGAEKQLRKLEDTGEDEYSEGSKFKELTERTITNLIQAKEYNFVKSLLTERLILENELRDVCAAFRREEDLRSPLVV